MHLATKNMVDISDVICALCDAGEWQLALQLARTADAWIIGEE